MMLSKIAVTLAYILQWPEEYGISVALQTFAPDGRALPRTEHTGRNSSFSLVTISSRHESGICSTRFM